ncbi:MAG: Ycf66 family protein [Cyanobacteria bacterium P01_F01_bin.143]
MLPYGLAIAVGLSSSILFLTAFFMPKIHRQDDFFWSGLGFFYALILWFCASQFTGTLLLGQLAVVALLISFSWQVIQLRKALINPGEQKKLDKFSVTGFIGGLFNRSPQAVSSKPEKVEEKVEEVEETEKVSETPVETEEETDSFPIIPVTEETIGDVGEEATEDVTEENIVDEIVSPVQETIPEPEESKDDTVIQSEESNIPSESQDSPVETETTAVESEPEFTSSDRVSDTTEKKPGLFNKIFKVGNKEQKPAPESQSSIINTKLDELLDDEEVETKSEETPEAISEPETPVSAETTEEPEEETNWDFLDDEAETTPEETTSDKEEVDSVVEESTDPTTTVDSEKLSSEEETS